MAAPQISRRSLLKGAAVAGLAAAVPPSSLVSFDSNRPTDYQVYQWMIVPKDIAAKPLPTEDALAAFEAAQNNLYRVNFQQYRYGNTMPFEVDIDYSVDELSAMQGVEIWVAVSGAFYNAVKARGLDRAELKHCGLIAGRIEAPKSADDRGIEGRGRGGARSDLSVAMALLDPQGFPNSVALSASADVGGTITHEMAHLFGATHDSPTDPWFPLMETSAVSRSSRWMAAPEREQTLLEQALTARALRELGELHTGAMKIGIEASTYAIYFQRGLVACKNDKAFVVSGSLYSQWQSAGGFEKIGFPTGPERREGSGKVRQSFEGGELSARTPGELSARTPGLLQGIERVLDP